MITCSACGKENEASAFECRRCRAPLRDDVVEPEALPASEPEPVFAHHEAAPHQPAQAHEALASSSTLGEVCRNCEAYNEPGVHACTNCGQALFVEPADATAAFEPALDRTPPHPFAPPDTSPSHAVSLDHTPPGGVPSLSDELSALAISDEEAAEAGLDTHDHDQRQSHSGSPEEEQLDKTPPQAFQAPFRDEEHDEPVHEKTPAQPFAAPFHDEPDHDADGAPSSFAHDAPAHHAPEAVHADHDAAPDSWGAAEEPHPHEEPAPAPHPVRSRVAEIAGVAAGAAMASAGIAAAALVPGRRSPASEPPPAKAEVPPPPVAKAEPPPAVKAEPAPAPAEKLCASCGAGNPPAAKFCFDCGTPFPKKAPPPVVEAKVEPKADARTEPKPDLKIETRPAPEVTARPEVKPEPARSALKAEPARPELLKADPKPALPRAEVKAAEVKAAPPSIEVDESFAAPDPVDATSESAPVSLFAEAPPEPAHLAAEAWAEEPPAGELPVALHDESLAPPHEPAAELDEELPAEAAPAEFLEEAQAVEGIEELPAEEATPADEAAFGEEALPAEEAAFAEELGEPLAEAVEEAPAPFHASLIVEKGAAPGTAFLLGLMHNRIGAAGAHVELAEDPFVAPQAATLLFADDHLVLRDEGTANGVYVKIRETASLEAGDQFTAGERLFRFDGVVELAKNGEGETPFLGAPRPQGPQAVRITEVLAGGKTGRTCHRSGPTIAIGRSGCDMNFPADAVLAARHAEIRLGEDGSASLVDLGAAESGVWLRVRQQASFDLVAGDLLQIGEQLLRLEVG